MTAVMQGVRVLEVAEHTFVPAASALLADWGADIVKIEPVERGDAMRGLASTGVAVVPDNVHALLEHSNRGKRSLGLDLKSEEGLEILPYYTFQVASGLQDTTGSSFTPFTSTFTTGTAGGNDGTMAFEHLQQASSQGQTYTCVTIGPDHKVYAGTMDGEIVRFNINADGTLGAATVITTVIDSNNGNQISPPNQLSWISPAA